jgi:hypothetical protein
MDLFSSIEKVKVQSGKNYAKYPLTLKFNTLHLQTEY